MAGIKRKASVVWCVEAESSARHEVAMRTFAYDQKQWPKFFSAVFQLLRLYGGNSCPPDETMQPPSVLGKAGYGRVDCHCLTIVSTCQ